GVAAGTRALGPRLRNRRGPGFHGRRLRAARARRDRVDDLGGQRPVPSGHGEARDDPRPRRRLRPPPTPPGSPAAAPRPLPPPFGGLERSPLTRRSVARGR